MRLNIWNKTRVKMKHVTSLNQNNVEFGEYSLLGGAMQLFELHIGMSVCSQIGKMKPGYI